MILSGSLTELCCTFEVFLVIYILNKIFLEFLILMKGKNIHFHIPQWRYHVINSDHVLFLPDTLPIWSFICHGYYFLYKLLNFSALVIRILRVCSIGRGNRTVTSSFYFGGKKHSLA